MMAATVKSGGKGTRLGHRKRVLGGKNVKILTAWIMSVDITGREGGGEDDSRKGIIRRTNSTRGSEENTSPVDVKVTKPKEGRKKKCLNCP